MKVEQFIKKQIKQIKKEVGAQKAVVACSGGVDSMTCTILAHQALGKNLAAIFVDDGLMRESEPEKVVAVLKKLGVKTKLLPDQTRFFRALKGKIDPEKKRKAFREVFYQVLGETLKIQKAKFLIQGTIKADIMETVGGIKTQHNVLEQIGINPQKYGFKVIEPLKFLYKPEVCQVAQVLGLPKEIYKRMPFPGPGLAIRIVGEVTPKKIRIVRRTTTIVEQELEKCSPFQAFAVLLSDKATGVRGGKRIFGNIIVIRSVDSKDAITASASEIPWKVLQKIRKKIIKEIPSVVRVLYELTPKPPATIEYI
ncbi:glutamine-hydrolyzing GMP synthase [Patescibacteria group bacterium]|nr:glutamine-hydrolyzing GMP synthase [Patescibacteria group bacterium]